MYLDPPVPTDSQIFVMHKVNAIIFWVMNVHNQLFDLQSLRTLNTPHQHSHRDNIRALQTIVQRLKAVETRQKSDFAHLDERSGLIAMDPYTFTAHSTIKDYINTRISDAYTTITAYIPARDIDFLKDREYTFYNKQVAPRLKESRERKEQATSCITSDIKELDALLKVVTAAQRNQSQSNDENHINHQTEQDQLEKHYFKIEDFEKEVKLFRKNLHTFDRKFSASTSDLINVRIIAIEKVLETHTQQCTNFTAATPDLINVRVNAIEAALEAHTQQCTNTPTSSYTPGTQIHLRLTEQDTRLDAIDSDHQLIIDSLDTLHTKITNNSNEPATHPGPLTDINASIDRM